MKKTTLAQLTSRDILLILTYAPAGLGHLRITDALYDGLPKTVNPVVLGSLDKSIQTLHRITSIHPIARAVFEWLQSGPLAYQANRLYRWQLRVNTGVIREELVRLIDERLDPPRKVLVVSTHFGLAHKLAAIKDKLEREKNVRIVLVVFVSDDTFQHIWYVDGADCLVVASNFIKRKYEAYGRRLGKNVPIEVISYPLNPLRAKPLSARELANKRRQLEATCPDPIRIAIPISGAAVGMLYFSHLIEALRKKSERFTFHIVSKDAPFTRMFLRGQERKRGVFLHVGKQDREVVDLYDILLEQEVISLEVTKPSEQAFKALLGTRSRGGVILLFSDPVGRQEFDNLDFLERHGLIPAKEENVRLWDIAASGIRLDPGQEKQLLKDCRPWRGIRLPKGSQRSADFIGWLLSTGILARMCAANTNLKVRDEKTRTLGANGVNEFWDLAAAV
jgi:hypothetical protein